jgi:predicted site-specific integrase-resolvase
MSPMQLLTPRQWAKKHGVHFSTVYRWIEAGKLAVVWQKTEMPKIPDDATPLQDVKA